MTFVEVIHILLRRHCCRPSNNMLSSHTSTTPMSRKEAILGRSQIESMIANGATVIIVDSKVLKVDAWLKYHPGGDKAIMHMVGRDATDEVNALVVPILRYERMLTLEDCTQQKRVIECSSFRSEGWMGDGSIFYLQFKGASSGNMPKNGNRIQQWTELRPRVRAALHRDLQYSRSMNGQAIFDGGGVGLCQSFSKSRLFRHSHQSNHSRVHERGKSLIWMPIRSKRLI